MPFNKFSHTYRVLALCAQHALPPDVLWEYVERPEDSAHPYGIIALNRSLSRTEQRRFNLTPY